MPNKLPKDCQHIASTVGEAAAASPAPADVGERHWAWASWACALAVGASLLWSAARPVPLEEGRGVPSGGASWQARPDAPGRYRGGPARDGRFPARGATRAPADDAVLRYAVGAPITGQAVVDGHGIYFAAHDGWLHALDFALRPRFRRPLGGLPFAGPVLVPGGDLLIGSDAGRVSCFSSAGDLLFTYDTGAPVDTAVAVHPAGFWLVASGRRLHAVDSQGHVRFVFAAAGKIFTTPAIDGAGRIYFAAQDDTVYALSAEGRLLWKVRGGADIDAGPMLHGARLLVGDDAGVVRALDSVTGRVVFERRLGGALRAPPALGFADSLLWNVFGPRARLLGLEPGAGELRFATPLGRADGPDEGTRSGPAVDAAGYVYVGSHEGVLHGLRPDGSVAFRFATGGAIDASPVLGPDGTLYFGSRDGVFYALPSR